MTIAPYQSTVRTGRDGFIQLVRGEWTKFRTVRGWVVATAVAVVLVVAFGILVGNGSHSSTGNTPQHPEGVTGHPYVPIGPDGEAVTDAFYFVHQPLAGDGSITTRVSALTGGTMSVNGGLPAGSNGPVQTEGQIQPWAKAGLIIKASTGQGSAYAAIMVTGRHGVRMQYNYTGDIAGPAGTVSTASPRWLRLTRAGDAVTGATSADGTTWTTVGTVHVAGLASATQVGMFVASPAAALFDQHLGGGTGADQATLASAVFDAPDLRADSSTGTWTGTTVGTSGGPAGVGQFHQAAGRYTVTGSGDIAPDVGDSGTTIEHTLAGAFAALAVLVVLSVLLISTEYRRGLIRISLTTSPRHGRVLAAKAVVLAAVAFVVGLVGAAAAIPPSEHLLRANGNFVYPITGLTELRVVIGTAALLAVASVLALAIGTMLRRSAGAVATAIVLVVLPYILATAGVLPAVPSQWLLRVTPAAAFAVQQSLPAYPQVSHLYTPLFGFFPLAPWTGFAVLCAWTAVALAGAAFLLHRRDV